MAGIIWTLITLLVIFWIVGLLLHLGGALIHIALLVAVILFIFNLFTRRGTTAM
jgi:hypothetical protein